MPDYGKTFFFVSILLGIIYSQTSIFLLTQKFKIQQVIAITSADYNSSTQKQKRFFCFRQTKKLK